ncbi:MAG: winged helix-turn-helix domain-containing protein [Alphaproteobacteria bacterium]|nr:MAG: winged helix-turn-helix domain-containing protein [Alphaproteobacteria bacterium]
MADKPVALSNAKARRLWLRAQRLDETAPFGDGPQATPAAVAHLGYVQIDTIHVVERSHHQILYTRIPDYRREHLAQAQSADKTVFEYWTHALSYIPTADMRFFARAMKTIDGGRSRSFALVTRGDLQKVLGRIRRNGPLTIRDIDDDVLVEKIHEWASRKPSKRALQLAFFRGILTVSRREGMLKTYELTTRHFGWDRLPKAASESERTGYLLDRALRAQGVVSLDSICHLDAPRKAAMHRLVAARVRRKGLVPVALAGSRHAHWAAPELLDAALDPVDDIVHILNPFDPLVIQRRRLADFFGYAHRFEAYLPKEKRVLGYFAQPVLLGDEIVAVLDLKTDRERQKLLVQKWTWIGKGPRASRKRLIEEALHRFERFQLAR